jgi:catechol 2,3-dioxygenase-like lactoylglutathione lyase family enzyme
MAAIAKLGAVSLDCDDPAALAQFYVALLGMEIGFESDDFIALQGGPLWLTFQRVADHRPATWPVGATPKQLHLELAVDDLDAAEAAALAIGAVKADTQPSSESWRVLIDPAGHPFCVTTLIPAA